jgi:hypothetical protein
MTFEELWEAHAKWSNAQFGDVSSLGPRKHLVKEAKELLADNTAEEYADCLMLVLDAARRDGFTPETLLEATKAKLDINKNREWPKAFEGKPCLHLVLD